MQPDSNRAPTRVYDLDSLRSKLEEERKAAPSHAGQVWYAGIEGRSVGPLTLAGLSGLVARGQLRRASLVWREGWAAWVPAEAVAELRALLGLPEPPASGDPPALPETSP
jgi:hypothetical protein